MSAPPLTAESFLADVAKHNLVIKINEGLYRHLHFSKPRNSYLWFDIVTWPGCLTIRGDMGTWIFSRVEDMFTFFRSNKLAINESYWSEKLLNGTSSHGARWSAQEFDEEHFRKTLIDHLTNHYDLQGERLVAVTKDLNEQMNFCSGQGQHAFLQAAYDFKSHGFEFECCELPSGMVYQYQFLWCLYAIVWGIQQYDALRPQESLAV